MYNVLYLCMRVNRIAFGPLKLRISCAPSPPLGDRLVNRRKRLIAVVFRNNNRNGVLAPVSTRVTDIWSVLRLCRALIGKSEILTIVQVHDKTLWKCYILTNVNDFYLIWLKLGSSKKIYIIYNTELLHYGNKLKIKQCRLQIHNFSNFTYLLRSIVF